MKCYVIKSKEGKYLSIASQNYEHYWTTLDFAYYFRFLPNVDAKELADDFKNSRYPDCEVVEIIIEEKKDYDVISKLKSYINNVSYLVESGLADRLEFEEVVSVSDLKNFIKMLSEEDK